MPEQQPQQEQSVTISPTMGPGPSEYRLLLNVTPRGGKLERRPSIKAKFLGYGYPYHDGSKEEAFQFNAESTTGTGATYTKQTGGGDVNEQHKGRWFIKPNFCPLDHVMDLPAGIDGRYEDIAEGIDVEIVNGKLIAFYASRRRLDSYANDVLEIRMKVSVHSVADPLIGSLGLGQRSQLSKRVSSTKVSGAATYKAVSYWEKRITRVSEGFAIVGRGVGGRVWSTGAGFVSFTEALTTFDDAGTKTETLTEIDDPDGLLWYQGFQLPFYRLGDPVSRVDRLVEDNVIYAKRRPHNAFLFIDEHGYPVWYGFNRADRQEVNAVLPSSNALLDGVPVQLRSGREYILDPGMVWYGEHLNLVSLPMQGYMTAQASTRSNEVVALCRTLNGTACFTRDSIEIISGHYLTPQVKLVHTGIGCDSRWSVKNVAQGVVFLNKGGLHFMGLDPATGQGSPIAVNRIQAFDELFGDGVDFERTPYSDLVVGDSTSETVPDHANAKSGSRYSQELDKVRFHTDGQSGTSLPFGKYRVDKTRLDRAVAGVWEDLYLCAVSRDIDDAGDDNRLILVWNYKEKASSVWLMPKHMGWRGFAYDGGISAPYVMTRYGLAHLGNNKEHDEPFYLVVNSTNAGDWRVDIKSSYFNETEAATIYPHDPSDRDTGDAETANDQYALPVLIAGQTRFFSGDGQAFILPKVMITHEKHRYGWTRTSTAYKDQDDWGYFKKDDDTDMRVQIWGNQTDLEAATMGENYGDTNFSSTESDYDMKSFSMTSIGMLDSLYKGNSEKEFRSVRVDPSNTGGAAQPVSLTHGHHRYGATFLVLHVAAGGDTDDMPSRRVRGPVLRTSTARSHVAATKQQVQFFTVDPGTIRSVIITVKDIVPPGGRS